MRATECDVRDLTLVGETRRIPIDEIEKEFLKSDWLPDVHEHHAINSLNESNTPKSGKTWTAEQVHTAVLPRIV